MKTLLCFLGIFLMTAGNGFGAEPVKSHCKCNNCKCTPKKHCGCYSKVGCKCSPQACQCGDDCRCGENSNKCE